jgi:glycosyltransferase involved in cell wall biosynthesis
MVNLSKKKKVIIITQHFPPEATGGASRLYEMARTLQDLYDVTVVCPPPTFPFNKYKREKYPYRKEKVNGFRVFRLWTYQPSKSKPSIFLRLIYYAVFPILAFFFLIGHLHGVSFVIITTPPSPLLITSLAVRLFRKKLIIDVRDFWIDLAVSLSYLKEDSFIVRWARKFEEYCWRKSDLIITNSRIIYEILSSDSKHANSKIKYFPFSVDLEVFKKVNGTPRKRQIVYIGNFGTAQNLKALISALPLVLEQVSDIKIQLYGGGDCEPEIKSLARDLDLEEYVKFNDPVPREQIPLILSQSMLGIIALSSHNVVRYALPTKSFEYFASGLPVVAYGASDELELIMKKSQAGIYVRGDDKKEIADAIINMINDNAAQEQYSINGRKFAEENTFHSLISDVQILMEGKQKISSQK